MSTTVVETERLRAIGIDILGGIATVQGFLWSEDQWKDFVAGFEAVPRRFRLQTSQYSAGRWIRNVLTNPHLTMIRFSGGAPEAPSAIGSVFSSIARRTTLDPT